MGPVVLITDFGERDVYSGIIKGVILNINPEVKLVDITHKVNPGDIPGAAFILSRSYFYFPRGTIFLAVVDPGVGSSRKAIAVRTRRYYFVGPDNGILSAAAREDKIIKIVELNNRKYRLAPRTGTFDGRDIFAPAAGFLSKKTPLDSLGPEIMSMINIELPFPKVKSDTIEGEVIHIDRFGNLITNIGKDLFTGFLDGRGFVARIKNRRVTRFYDFYARAEENRPFLISGSFNLMEISLKNKSAAGYFNLTGREKVKIKVIKT